MNTAIKFFAAWNPAMWVGSAGACGIIFGTSQSYFLSALFGSLSVFLCAISLAVTFAEEGK